MSDLSTATGEPLRAMVLAAGLGTRLGALSDERPKPLLPVCDVPILRYGLALLHGHGVREAAMNLHHLGDRIVSELEGRSEGIALTYSREETILGTGGGLQRMAAWLTQGGRAPFLVMNGKLVLAADLAALVRRHHETGAVATMLVREVPDAEKWGAVDVDADGRVLRILGEGQPGTARYQTMFCGVHVVSPELVGRLPGGASCVIRQGYLPLLRAGARVEAVLHAGYFQEHSTPARYLEGNLAVLRGEARLAYLPGPTSGVAGAAHVHPTATLRGPHLVGEGATVGAGATIGPDVVVGHGATVGEGVSLERVVVWPGARALESAKDAIVTARGTFPVGKDTK